MRIALEEAEAALSSNNLPVGVVVVMDGEVISRGRRSGETVGKMDHAEMSGIRHAYRLYPKGFLKMWVFATLEPCLMCLGTIRQCRIPRVVYALEDPFAGCCGLPPSALPEMYQINPFEFVPGVLRAESKALFREFFRTTDQQYWHENPDNPLVKMVMAD